MDTPILFVTFNRPELSSQVFEKIRAAKPKRLYFASDGPRDHVEGEAEKVMATRSLVARIDWECELFTLFRQQNVGMSFGYCGAVEWIFDSEERAIILEDDTLPSRSFFPYCSELLEKYKDDSRIMNICGFNACANVHAMAIGDDSYFFSHLGHAWGWATWRRAWAHYRFHLSNWDRVQQYKTHSTHPLAYFRQGFEGVTSGTSQSCMLRWYYAMAVQNGLSILPRQSLIRNIGVGESATTTKTMPPEYENTATHELNFPLVHPVAIFSNFQFDSFRMPRKKNFLVRIVAGYRMILHRIKQFFVNFCLLLSL